ncbi:hypothetical protein DAPPUDRAFT_112149 [Daphnia pulex]|uniref:Uncharacterized protein n=1 Tax=Daphnia pulex TaxID=6669 RepID=E9HB16_DAPPU|nr:hypothetical protein DAPPUDRAFT_112149 [Daphnia pulex]|eukprot:EFX71048.1 hypothetical protein DAPPUDRAFT_112149 [Daphnia pulex]
MGLFEYRDSAQESSTDWEIAIAMNTEQHTKSAQLRRGVDEPRGPPTPVSISYAWTPSYGLSSLNHPVGLPDCTCDNTETQWAAAIDLVRESSKCFVEAGDTKACWDLLAKLFELPFSELIKLTAPYSLQVRPSREAAAAKARLTQDLPPEAQEQLRECEETLKKHADLVDSHKAVAKHATKRKILIFQEAEFAVKEARLEQERQALNIKRRRTEADAVQINHTSKRQEIPRAHAGVSGFKRQISAEPLVTSRQEWVKAAYIEDLQPPKVQRGSESAGTDPSKDLPPSKGKKLSAPVGISL